MRTIKCHGCKATWESQYWIATGETYFIFGGHAVIRCPTCLSIQTDITIGQWEKEAKDKENHKEKIREAKRRLAGAEKTTKDLRKELEELKGQKV